MYQSSNKYQRRNLLNIENNILIPHIRSYYNKFSKVYYIISKLLLIISFILQLILLKESDKEFKSRLKNLKTIRKKLEFDYANTGAACLFPQSIIPTIKIIFVVTKTRASWYIHTCQRESRQFVMPELKSRSLWRFSVDSWILIG